MNENREKDNFVKNHVEPETRVILLYWHWNEIFTLVRKGLNVHAISNQNR